MFNDRYIGDDLSTSLRQHYRKTPPSGNGTSPAGPPEAGLGLQP
jgi:hypothetical protein